MRNGRYRLVVMTPQVVLFRQHYPSLRAAVADAKEAVAHGTELRATIVHVSGLGTESQTIAEFASLPRDL